MIRIVLICTLFPHFVSAMAAATANPPQHVVLAHKKRSADELFAMIPSTLSPKPLVQLNALLEQTDTFSCVYRSLFHAQCFTLAAQKVAQGEPFETHLKSLLQDEQLLNRTFEYVKTYLDLYHSDYDRTQGLTINQFLGVCAASIPLLHNKLLPVRLEDDKKIYAVHDPTPALPSPISYSTSFIRHYDSARFPLGICNVELDTSSQLKYQLAQLNAPHSVAHFFCRFPKHIFMASILTDENCFAKLYVIDSNNNNVATHPSFSAFTSKLLEYTEQHNTKHAQQLDKKQKTTAAVALQEK